MSTDTDAQPVELANADALDRLVADRDLAIVEFYTEGCGICAGMEPVLGTVAKASDATVALINPRGDPALIERFEITSVPTLIRFRDGTPVARLADGFHGVEDVLAFLEEGREP